VKSYAFRGLARITSKASTVLASNAARRTAQSGLLMPNGPLKLQLNSDPITRYQRNPSMSESQLALYG